MMAFAPAAAIGSFLNVVAGRLPNKMSLVRPRSACPSCKHEIAWYDNVPLVSFAVLRGRCRSCHTAISWRYPLVVLSAIDLEHRILPDRITLPSAAIVLVANTLLHPSPQWAIASLGAALF